MGSTRKIFGALTRRGPHRVLRGDLAFAGLPGVVYTPEAGKNLPAVAFGHDWVTPVARYRGLLEHLASWGIVAAAPNTERSVAPSVLNLAFDLGTALDIAAGVRLGPGRISVHPTKLGVAGHGFGASAAVFAAAGMPAKPAAVAAVFPTVTSPSARQPAAELTVPAMVLASADDATGLRSDAAGLARAWPTAVLRTVVKAHTAGLVEGRRLTRLVGLPGGERATQKAVRALLTGYLLYELAGDKTYRDFADPEVVLPKTAEPDPDAPPAALEDRVVALLR
ncbi:hypothetical protein H7J77_07805 [Mycolicibacillus parakoreensis]|uniref:Alpha/beta hydrolase n=1 Tax=Mycolicibacillus parakoreensis TaxID=1069221 RepID=A0ABY3TWI0_9MYCO|nr:hypothetical protein [Mycolicibacillus parakoreensis]MCV7315442.1 hypothetical protein [Mycolicibacillus parakoreensis]ULN52094.1 hypothetical protein MIU77_14695 [Mycolicibacillus parakoreensis]HLR99933.1 hypothetical protein [Mycolicibacillus parakoreensis]